MHILIPCHLGVQITVQQWSSGGIHRSGGLPALVNQNNKLKHASAKCTPACTAIEARVERRHVQIVSKHVGQRLAIRRRQQRCLLPQTAADILVDVPLPTLRS